MGADHSTSAAALAARLNGMGATVSRDERGNPVINLNVGGDKRNKPKAAKVDDRGDLGSRCAVHLKAFVERFGHLFDQQAETAEDVKALAGEAKSMGFEPAIIKKIVKMLREDEGATSKRLEQEALLEVYRRALGV